MSFNWAQPAQPSTTGFSFGSSQPAQPATTGFSFGQTSTFGGFGQNTAPAQQAPGFSFGQPSQQPALGATPGQTPAFSFGQPTGGGFSLPGGTPSGFGGLGATPAAPAFPSTTNAFTANPPATPWNSNQNNAFGSGGLSFGTSNPSQQSTGAFGQSVGFGSAPSAPQQQQQQQNTGFGGFSGFGQPSQGFGNFQQQQPQQQQQQPQQQQSGDDYAIQTGFSDSISCIGFNPNAQFIAAGSWDGKVRVWDIARSPSLGGSSMLFQTTEKMAKEDGAPILDLKWSPWDNGKIYTAGCNKTVRLWDLATNQSMDIGQHSEPIKSLHPCLVGPGSQPCVVTGCWGKQLMYWDPRSPKPALSSVALPERVFAMDVRDNNMVIATAPPSTGNNLPGSLHVFDIRNNPQSPTRSVQSAFKFATRTVRIFADAQTYAYATIEGRCRVNCLRESDDNANQVGDTGGPGGKPRPLAFVFRCHRISEKMIFPVNAIDVHPDPSPAMNPVFATAGSDGCVTLWNRYKRMKVNDLFSAQYASALGPENTTWPVRLPITDVKFSADGNTLAYSASYDYSRGKEGLEEHNTKAQPNVIYLRHTPPQQLQTAKK